MPRPPPDTPLAGMVAGWLPLGGGNDEVCTALAGARCCWIEPVASCCDAYGLLLKRVDSELQAAAPTAITVKAKDRNAKTREALTRGNARERNSTTDMVSPLVRNTTNKWAS